MPKLCELKGVRGGDDGLPVELWRDDETNRLEVVAYCEAGFSSVGIDLADLLSWLDSDEGRRLYSGNVAGSERGGN